MKQGEIWFADLTPVKGSEQSGYRPVLIISGNLLNTYAPVIICCPLTTKIKNYKGNVVLQPDTENGLKQTSEVLTFHVLSISKDRLTQKIGEVPSHVILSIKTALNELLSY